MKTTTRKFVLASLVTILLGSIPEFGLNVELARAPDDPAFLSYWYHFYLNARFLKLFIVPFALGIIVSRSYPQRNFFTQLYLLVALLIVDCVLNTSIYGIASGWWHVFEDKETHAIMQLFELIQFGVGVSTLFIRKMAARA